MAVACLAACSTGNETALVSVASTAQEQTIVEEATTYEEFVAYAGRAAGVSWEEQHGGNIVYKTVPAKAGNLSIGLRISMTQTGHISPSSKAELAAMGRRLNALLAQPRRAHNGIRVSLYPIAPLEFIAGFGPGQSPHGRRNVTPPFAPNLKHRIDWQNRMDDFRAFTGETRIAAPTARLPEGALVVLSGGDWVGRRPRFETPAQGWAHIEAIMISTAPEGGL